MDELNSRATTKLLREEIGFIFQGFNLVPSLTAADNVALAAQYAGKSKTRGSQAGRPGRAGHGWDGPTAPPTAPTSSPGGSSNEWPSPGRW